MNKKIGKQIKVKVDFEENDSSTPLLEFIKETQKGKYTEHKPEIESITYKRIQTLEFDYEEENEVILFGIS